MRTPDCQQISHRAAAYVDDVLFEHDLLQRPLKIAEAEQRDVGWHARPPAEARVESIDLCGCVTRGGWQEEDAGLLGLGEREHVIVEQRIGRLHREATATHRKDQSLLLLARGAHASATALAAVRPGCMAAPLALAPPRLVGPPRSPRYETSSAVSLTWPPLRRT